MRAALAKRVIANCDNGFLPEGSALEGYDASHAPGAFPVERVFAVASLASERKAENLPALITALGDSSEPVRWWAAQGCTMLREKAAPAEASLRKCLTDSSGSVQVAAAEALVRLGKPADALTVLGRWVETNDSPGCVLQAANILDRLGEVARPLMPVMKRALAGAKPTGRGGTYPPQHILTHAIAVLEGREQPLVYPQPGSP